MTGSANNDCTSSASEYATVSGCGWKMLPWNSRAGSCRIACATQLSVQVFMPPSPSTRDQCEGASASGHVCITASSVKAPSDSQMSRV